jgi:TP901 family phage tail tape measure protein
MADEKIELNVDSTADQAQVQALTKSFGALLAKVNEVAAAVNKISIKGQFSDATTAKIKQLESALRVAGLLDRVNKAAGAAELAQIREAQKGAAALNKLINLRAQASREANAEEARGIQALGAQIQLMRNSNRLEEQRNRLKKQAADLEVQASFRTDQIAELKDLISASKKRLADARAQKVSQAEINAAVQQEIALQERLNAKIAEVRAQRAAAAAAERNAGRTPASASVERVLGVGALDTFKIQAALLANYATIGGAIAAFSQGTRFALEFENALKNLQAISASTSGEMQTLSAEIQRVSQNSRFSAIQVAEAGTILAQAGFSAQQIGVAVEGVVQLATATGSDLAQAVDLATSAIGAFNLRADEMGNISNLLTAAVNKTKLTIDKVALGFQYAANVAAQAGISVNELTALMGVLSNAGIRSGSTLGTGLRQILLELEAPSEKFVETIHRLGLTTEDVSLRNKSFVDVLKTLKQAGFSAADGLKVFEVRSAAAFSALIGRVDEINKLQQEITGTTAAMQANQTQMQSTINTVARFTSTVGVAFSKALEPALATFRVFLSGLTELTVSLSKIPGLLQLIGTVGTGAALAGLVVYFGHLLKLVTSTSPVVLGISAGLNALALSATRAGGAVAALNTVLALFARHPIIAIWTAIAAAIAGAVTLISSFSGKADDLAKNLDAAKSAFNAARDAVDQQNTAMGEIDRAYQQVIDRQDDLRNDASQFQTTLKTLTEQFNSLSVGIFDNVDSVEELIEAFRKLKTEVSDEIFSKMALAYATATAQADAARELLASSVFDEELADLSESFRPTRGPRGIGQAPSPFSGAEEVLAIIAGIREQKANVTAAQLNNALARLNQMLGTAERQGFGGPIRELIEHLTKRSAAVDDRDSGESGAAAEISGAQARAVDRILTDAGLETIVSRVAAAASAYQRARETATSSEENEAALSVLRKAIEAASGDVSKAFSNVGVRDQINRALPKDFPRVETTEDALALIAQSSSLAGFRDVLASADIKVAQGEADSAEARAELADLRQQATKAVIDQTESLIKELNDPAVNEQLRKSAVAQIHKLADEQRAEALAQLEKDKSSSTFKDRANAEERYANALVAINQEETEALTRVENLANDVRQKQEDTHRQHREKITRLSVQRLDQLLDLQSKFILPTETVEDIKARYDRASDLFEQKRRAAEIQLETELSDPRFSDEERTLRREALIAQFETDKQELDQKFAELIANANRPLNVFKLFLDEFKEAMRRIERVYARSVQKARNELDAFKAQQDARDLPQNRGRIFATEGADERAQLEAEQRFGAAQVAALQAKLSAMDSFIAELTVKFQELEADADKSRAALEAAKAAGSPDVALLTLVDQNDQKAALEAEKALNDAKDELLETQLELNQAQLQYNLLTTQLPATSVGQVFGLIADYMASASLEAGNLAVMLGQTLKAGVDTAKTSLGQFFRDIARQSKTAGDAFREFALSILDSMLQVVTNKLALQFIGLLGTAFGGDTGAGLTTNVGTDVLGGFFNFNGGGLIRRAGGGITQRDRVPILGREGEYMLRKSAVDLIGRDTLDHINALGNQTVSRSAPPPLPANNNAPPMETNVWLVSKDQVPPPGPKDIVAIIGEDISGGGVTKKLIKQVVAGHL